MTFESTHPVALGDLTFDVRSAGEVSGEPIMLLHGFPQTSLCWSQLVPRLIDAGFRVFAPDQRGYSPGARPLNVDAYATDLLAADVLGLADALGLDSFHLAGHDWGAVIGWLAAANHPDRVRTLTAASVPHLGAYNAALRTDPDQQAKAAYIKEFRKPGTAEELLLADEAQRLTTMYGDAVSVGLAIRYVSHLAEPGALTAALNWYRAMTPALEATPRVHVPTTYIWGEQDMAIGRVPAEACGDYVDGDYRFIELAGIGHWIPEQAPESLAEAIIVRART